MLRTLIKENGEAQQAVASLVDGADDQELQEAHRELPNPGRRQMRRCE